MGIDMSKDINREAARYAMTDQIILGGIVGIATMGGEDYSKLPIIENEAGLSKNHEFISVRNKLNSFLALDFLGYRGDFLNEYCSPKEEIIMRDSAV
jgi:hypothetical protein